MLDELIQKSELAPKIDCEAFYEYAYALYQANQSSKAAEVFEVLCTRFPLDYRFWFGLGASLQESNLFEKALSAWAMAAFLDPPNPYPHFHAAECAHSLNHLSDALLAIKEAKERVKESSHPLYAKIELLETLWSSP